MATPPKEKKAKKTRVVYDGSAPHFVPNFDEVDIVSGKVQQGNFVYQSKGTAEVAFADKSICTVFAGQLVEVANMQPQKVLEYVTDDDE